MTSADKKILTTTPLPTRTWAGLTVLVIMFILYALPPMTDSDFGWHLKSGQIYAQTHHIPSHDVFSYTMSGYAWVNHEYASDILYYFLYQLGGQTTILISLFFLLLAVLIFLVVLPKTFPYTLEADERLFAGLIALFASYEFFSARSQILDWLGFLLVILIWKQYQKTLSYKKLLWYIPLFFLWANLHAGFVIGFAILGFLFFFDIIDQCIIKGFRMWSLRETYRLLTVVGIILASVVATLITPYGIGLYQDIVNTLTSKTMLSTINEWQASDVAYIAILPFTVYAFSLILLLMLFKREKPFVARDAIAIIIFLFLALSSLRLIPFFILLSLPLFAGAFREKNIFLPVMMLFIIPSFLISSAYNKPAAPPTPNNPIHTSSLPRELLLQEKDIFYPLAPASALAYLRAHPMQGNVFNEYGWGGTMIWSFPQYKTFIDGRMPYWKLDGRDIFNDYLAIQGISQGWNTKINEYGIDWFFIRKATPIAALLETMPEVWAKQYDDGYAVIFTRKK